MFFRFSESNCWNGIWNVQFQTGRQQHTKGFVYSHSSTSLACLEENAQKRTQECGRQALRAVFQDQSWTGVLSPISSRFQIHVPFCTRGNSKDSLPATKSSHQTPTETLDILAAVYNRSDHLFDYWTGEEAVVGTRCWDKATELVQ